jgi:hypothetical protein
MEPAPDLLKKIVIVIILVILWGTVAWFVWPKDAASAVAAITGGGYALV